MKKVQLKNKLAALGVKWDGTKTVPELRVMLTAAQNDAAKPGHNIHTGPQPGDRIA